MNQPPNQMQQMNSASNDNQQSNVPVHNRNSIQIRLSNDGDLSKLQILLSTMQAKFMIDANLSFDNPEDLDDFLTLFIAGNHGVPIEQMQNELIQRKKIRAAQANANQNQNVIHNKEIFVSGGNVETVEQNIMQMQSQASTSASKPNQVQYTPMQAAIVNNNANQAQTQKPITNQFFTTGGGIIENLQIGAAQGQNANVNQNFQNQQSQIKMQMATATQASQVQANQNQNAMQSQFSQPNATLIQNFAPQQQQQQQQLPLYSYNIQHPSPQQTYQQQQPQQQVFSSKTNDLYQIAQQSTSIAQNQLLQQQQQQRTVGDLLMDQKQSKHIWGPIQKNTANVEVSNIKLWYIFTQNQDAIKHVKNLVTDYNCTYELFEDKITFIGANADKIAVDFGKFSSSIHDKIWTPVSDVKKFPFDFYKENEYIQNIIHRHKLEFLQYSHSQLTAFIESTQTLAKTNPTLANQPIEETQQQQKVNKKPALSKTIQETSSITTLPQFILVCHNKKEELNNGFKELSQLEAQLIQYSNIDKYFLSQQSASNVRKINDTCKLKSEYVTHFLFEKYSSKKIMKQHDLLSIQHFESAVFDNQYMNGLKIITHKDKRNWHTFKADVQKEIEEIIIFNLKSTNLVNNKHQELFGELQHQAIEEKVLVLMKEGKNDSCYIDFVGFKDDLVKLMMNDNYFKHIAGYKKVQNPLTWTCYFHNAAISDITIHNQTQALQEHNVKFKRLDNNQFKFQAPNDYLTQVVLDVLLQAQATKQQVFPGHWENQHDSYGEQQATLFPGLHEQQQTKHKREEYKQSFQKQEYSQPQTQSQQHQGKGQFQANVSKEQNYKKQQKKQQPYDQNYKGGQQYENIKKYSVKEQQKSSKQNYQQKKEQWSGSDFDHKQNKKNYQKNDTYIQYSVKD